MSCQRMKIAQSFSNFMNRADKNPLIGIIAAIDHIPDTGGRQLFDLFQFG